MPRHEVPLVKLAGWDISARFLTNDFADIVFRREGEERRGARLVMSVMQFIDSPPPLTRDQVTEIWQAVQRSKEQILTPVTYPRLREKVIRDLLPRGHGFFLRTGDGWTSGHLYIYSRRVIPKETREAIVQALSDQEMCSWSVSATEENAPRVPNVRFLHIRDME